MNVARVTHAEANLLTLARCTLGFAPVTELTRLLLASATAPATLGPTSAALVKDTLARGVVFALVHEGGWTREATGRLWDEPLPPLRFTSNVVRLFQWALALPLAETGVGRLELAAPLTPAEEVVAVLLLERARGSAAEATLMLQPALRAAPLVQLVHAAPLGRVAPLEVAPLTKAHLPFVRGLLDLLGDAWFSAESLKRQLDQPKVLVSVSRAQAAVAGACLDVLDAERARHLARFFIDAAAAWLARGAAPADLVALDPDSPLRERSEARREAAVLWRVVQRLEQWDAEHRATRFIDDGYDTAQALVRDWERLGPSGFRAAERFVAELEGLPV